jgi:hypothetical protein
MAEMDITKTLVVGQNVFMRSGQVGNWAKVIKVTPTGVIVESDPVYGSELIRFDENGTACDSSDLCNDKGVRGGSKIPGTSSGPWKLYLDTKAAGFAKTIDPETAGFVKALQQRDNSKIAEFLSKRKRNS